MLKKLVNGEYSLKITFWLFGFLGFSLFGLITQITHNGVLRLICPGGRLCPINLLFYTFSHLVTLLTGNGRVLTNLIIHIFVSTLFLIYMYLTLRGLFKCSASYDGKKIWPIFAKIALICLSIIGLKSII